MRYPRHVAIIPDWNRTRAKENNKTIQEWYIEGYKKGVELLKYSFLKTDIQTFTLRWLSTENVKKRTKEEINFLMTMYKIVWDELIDFLVQNKINLKRIWNPKYITKDFIDDLNKKQEQTKCDSNKTFIFAISYWWRDEIIRGIQKLKTENFNFDNLDEEIFSKKLDLGEFSTIDLIIRTKGDFAHRTSWFMSRRIGYAELYFTKKKCPDFNIENYKEALLRFDKIQRYRNFWA